MRQGPYDVQVLTEDGRVLPEREVDGRTVLEAEQGLTYRVKVRVHADADGKFPTELMYARLYVDGNHAEWRGMRLKDGGAQAEWTFCGFRKNQYEKVAFVFALPESTTQHAPVDEQNTCGTLKVIFYRAHDTGKIGEVIEPSTVPARIAAAVEGAKFWKQPSVVTETGKRLESKVTGRCAKWTLGEELAAFTLPYQDSARSSPRLPGTLAREIQVK
jgi:hypothetical protein